MVDPLSSGPISSGGKQSASEALLRNELSACDQALANCAPILRHLLRNEDASIYSELIVARVRGMFQDIARQLVIALAEAAGHAEPQAWAHEAAGELAALLAENPIFLAHFHALALEWQMAERLQTQMALDPVVTPLLQARIASADPEIAATAMSLLAAQARFGQAQRRMLLPMAELPGDLFHVAMVTMRTYVGHEASADGYALIAERAMRARFDEQRGRLALVGRVLGAMADNEARSALSIEHAGVTLFVTALGQASGIGRESIIMASTEGQHLRMALALCASGLGPDRMTSQFCAIHPDAVLPEAVRELEREAAAAVLRDAGLAFP